MKFFARHSGMECWNPGHMDVIATPVIPEVWIPAFPAGMTASNSWRTLE